MAVDMVNRPPHYTFGTVEVIDFIDSMGAGYDFATGNAIKYIARADHKGSKLEDLKKARFYVQHILEKQMRYNPDIDPTCKPELIDPYFVTSDWKLSNNPRDALIEIVVGGRKNLEAAVARLTREIEKAEK